MVTYVSRIGFITTNKVLAQSLSSALKDRAGSSFEPFLLLSPGQAELDTQVLQIDVALVDVMDRATGETALPLCKTIRESVPSCRILLLLSQRDKDCKSMVIAAVRENIADDFVFYDASLDYLIAKLSAFCPDS